MHDLRSVEQQQVAPARRPRPDWLLVLIASMLALGALSAGALALDLGRVYGGFTVFYSFGDDRWRVDFGTPIWWPALASHCLRLGDVVETIDGEPSGLHVPTAFQTGSPDRQVLVTIRHGERRATCQLTLRPFTFADYVDLKLPEIVIGLGFWLLSLVIYRSRPAEPLNRVFASAAAVIAGYQWLGHASLFPFGNSVAILNQLVWEAGVSVMGVLFLHCAVLFPVPLVRSSVQRGLRLAYGLAALLAMVYMFSTVWFVLTGPGPLVTRLADFGFDGATTGIALGVLAMIARQTTAFFSAPSPRVRRQVGVVWLGTAGTLPVVAVSIIGAFTRETQYFWSGLDLRGLYLALPLAFTYVILRYQTFRSASPPLFVAALVLNVSVLIASVGDWLLRSLDLNFEHSAFALFFGVSLATGLLWSAQGPVQRRLQRLFNWESTRYGAARRFGERVLGQTDLARLPEMIVSAVVSELQLEQAAIWLWDDSTSTFKLAAQAGRWPGPPPDRLVPPDRSAPLTAPVDLSDEVPDWLQRLSSTTLLGALAPLNGPAGPIGLLGLGKRVDEEIFHDRDLEILELIAQQAALFLLTAQQIDELKQVPRRVSDAQERERFRIAQELHDTIQQFLGRLPFFLEVSRSAAHDDPARADALLQRCIEDVEQAARTVRQIRANLAPFQLQTSFIRPVQDLIERFSQRHHLPVQVDLAPEVEAALPIEARHALYRVIQQALDNAATHARATRLTVRVLKTEGQVAFEICDNGVGSSEADRAQAVARGSFGLKSMRDRIESLGGKFEMISAPGQGTKVRGQLPIADPTMPDRALAA